MAGDDVAKFIKELGEKINSQFLISLEALKRRILDVDPYSLLAFFSYYELIATPGANREWTEENPILQHHVEFLQGLILQNPQNSFDVKPVLPQDFIELRELVQDVTKGFQLKRLALVEPSTSSEQRQQISALEHIRTRVSASKNVLQYTDSRAKQ